MKPCKSVWDLLRLFEAIKALLRHFWGQLWLFEFIQGFSRPLEAIAGIFGQISRFFKPQDFCQNFFCQIQENQNIHPGTFWAVYPKLLHVQQRHASLLKALKLFFQMPLIACIYHFLIWVIGHIIKFQFSDNSLKNRVFRWCTLTT